MSTVTPGWHYKKRRRIIAGVPEYYYTRSSDGAVAVATGTKFVNLQTLLRAAGGDYADIIVSEYNSDNAFRFYNRAVSAYYASDLIGTIPVECPAALPHTFGAPWGQIVDQELDECLSYLETTITGYPIRSWGWPYHANSNESMALIACRGISAARDGTIGYEPYGTYVLGTSLTDVKIIQNYQYFPRYSLPIQGGFNTAALTGKSKVQMSDYLYNVGGAGAAPERFGYSSLMEAWKDNHACLQFYLHGNGVGDLTGPELQSLLEIFQEDGDF